jgi:hypothetical protein
VTSIISGFATDTLVRAPSIGRIVDFPTDNSRGSIDLTEVTGWDVVEALF